MTGFVNRSLRRSESGLRIQTEEDQRDPLFLRAAARTMQVLSAFHEADHPLSLTEIAREAQLDRSTTQRIVHTLRQLGYITRDRHDRGYVPGLRIYDHIFDAMRLDETIQQAVPLLLELRRTVNERVDLSLIDDTRLVYAARLQPKREVLHAMLVGLSVPAYCTSAGWAVLSRLPEDEARDILRRSERRPFTHRTLIDEDAIMAEVRTGARQGYVIAEEQLLPGEIGIAAAVTGPGGRPVAAINVTALMSDWTVEDFTRQVAPALVQTASALSSN